MDESPAQDSGLRNPSASLPVELLIAIFEFYLDIDPAFEDEFHGYITTVSDGSPIILMQVCRHWRAITLAAPSLWTFVCPSYEPIPEIRRWISICPKYPLDVRLARRFVEDVPRDYVSSIFDLFANEGYRWRSLSIELDPSVAEKFVKLLRSQDAAPFKLEDLKVDVLCHDHNWVPRPTLSTIIALLPRLKALRRLIWDDRFGEVSLHGIPWNQLKTVIVNVPSSLQDVFSYLSQCTSATTVEIHGESPDYPEKTTLPSHRFPPFVVHNLTSLKLSRGCDPMWLLRHVTAPSIQHLEIAILRRNQRVLEEFVNRSPRIHTLVIDERHGGNGSYVDEVLISDYEISAYLTSSCLRTIPRVGIDLMYTKERVLALIQQRSNAHEPLPPLSCWRPSLDQRLVGWWDGLDAGFETLLFSYKDGSIQRYPRLEFDDLDGLL